MKIRRRKRDFTNQIIHGDCLQVMKEIPDKSIDMVLCDLPYGITACKWDLIIPLEQLWIQYKRISKSNIAFVFTASQPFTTSLINSNPDWFKYCWCWNKNNSAGFSLANKRPLMIHEDILIFINKNLFYYPQMTQGKFRKKGGYSKSDNYGIKPSIKYDDKYYPKSILNISNADHTNKLHSTQKPIKLFSYLIKTYTNEGALVLDNCIGSGTTAIACLETGRNYIGIEKDKEYYDIACKRVKEWKQKSFYYKGKIWK